MTNQQPQLTSKEPVKEIIFNADKENFAAADSLPPLNSLPTDQQVLNKEKITTAEIPINPEETEEEVDIEQKPVIEAIVPEKNSSAEAAKNLIDTNEQLEEFKLDNPEDTDFLKQLGYGKEKGVLATTSDVTKEKDIEPRAKYAKEIEAELETKYAPVKAKAAELEQIISDPMTKALIEFRKSGKTDLNEFAKEVGFINVESMTDKDVIEHECKASGLTPEETEVEVESLDGMTPLQKKNYINSVKAKLISQRDEKLKTFSSVNKETQNLYSEAVKSGTSQLDELIPKMENKKFEGLLITPEMANNIKSEVLKNAKQVFNDKGQLVAFDIKTSVEIAVATLYKNEWKKALVELGRTLGADKALSARIRANKNITTSGVIPTSQESLKDTAKAVADEQWNKSLQGKKLTTK